MNCMCGKKLKFKSYILNKYGSGKSYHSCECGMGWASRLTLNRKSDLLDNFNEFVRKSTSDVAPG